VNACDHLVLGTAQLGMPYGVANMTGQPDSATLQNIVATAWGCGVRLFDTAPAYGKSEEVLGQAIANLSLCEEAGVISKFDFNSANPGRLLQEIESSRARLKVPQLWGGLLHSEEQLDDWIDSVGEVLTQARRSGLVARIGVSIYSPARALQALQLDNVDLVQVPANIFDRRMERAGVFAKARERGKDVFIRSVYLQGLALMPAGAVPERIPQGRKAVSALQQFCAEHKTEPRHFAINYVRQLAPSARLIIGAETVSQARENCAAFEREPVTDTLAQAWNCRWPEDVDALIDPRGWPPIRKTNESCRYHPGPNGFEPFAGKSSG
jgi:aryl-alcohol dehydrogenase-like predicted oxidoreductase